MFYNVMLSVYAV